MSIYECPYCHEKVFNPITKAFAGAINTKGKLCPKCGKACTNGLGSSIFHTIIDAVILILSVLCYIKDIDLGLTVNLGGAVLKGSYIVIVCMIAAGFVINKIFDAFFLPMAKSARNDAYIR